MRFYQLPDTLQSEVDKFQEHIAEYTTQQLNPVAWKGIRVAHGVYEQRKPETHMIRIRCSGGAVTPHQLATVGELARDFGSGEVHVTTRQELQIHYVDVAHVIEVYNRLRAVGLSPRGGGGNTIRNVLSSHDAGVSQDEVFDVSPYAHALTTRLIAEADSWNLPRKFKIAFSGNSSDNARATITCLGFIAREQNGQKGFRVYCAGGMGAAPMPGKVLFDFVDDSRVYYIARAMKTMFDKYGNRRQRSKARLKFLWDKLGEEQFREKFHEEYDELIKDDTLALQLEPFENTDQTSPELVPVEVNGQEFSKWKQRHCKEQKQAGLFHITLPLRLGDFEAEEAIAFSEALKPFGQNILRLSIKQNAYLRNIPEKYLGNIYTINQQLTSLSSDAEVFGNMIACTGADTCKLGICLPRGVTPRIQDILRSSGLDLDQLSDVNIHISGCPNTCGCHHIADLGFFGKVLRSGRDLLPGYNILVGGVLGDGKTTFSKKVDDVPAKELPEFIKTLLGIYLEKKNKYSGFSQYIASEEGIADVKQVADTYRSVTPLNQSDYYFYDWGSADQFSLLKGQKAECSAGMFDMIDVDAKTIKLHTKELEQEQQQQKRLEHIGQIVYASSRMLLVTRGLEPKNDEQLYSLFKKHFIETDLVPDEYTELVDAAKASDNNTLLSLQQKAVDLGAHMVDLYKSMDDSLRFNIDKKSEGVPEVTAEKPQTKTDSAERFKDLRGVACPMNFVKTKLELAAMNAGDKLRILLDDGEPIQNVPGSVRLEGHTVLSQEPLGSHWMVLIEKA